MRMTTAGIGGFGCLSNQGLVIGSVTESIDYLNILASFAVIPCDGYLSRC